jgi:tetratricopeptide (TPR) repeat protein
MYEDAVDARVFALTLPSALVLALLVTHALKTLPRGRAIAFWASVVGYGIARGVALRWVTEHGPSASFPYTIRNPLFPVLGVPLQEIAGWAIVAYVGWWLGCRLTRRLFAQVAWACLFLGAISWAVETAAVAAGWWSWSVPVTLPVFLNVPFIGIVDWLFVGIDFLLPFVMITAPSLRGRPVRFASLLAFPLHFGAHVFADRTIPGLPIPIHHGAHWLLLGVLLVLALRSEVEDDAFPGQRATLLPLAGLAIVLIDVALVEIFVVRRPDLMISLLPAVSMVLQTVKPAAGYAAGAAALLLGAWRLPTLLAAAPAALSGALTFGPRFRWSSPVAGAMIAALAYGVHATGERRRDELTQGLDAALAARDRGDLDEARHRLSALARDFPGSHVPPALRGEIDYRTGRLDDAREAFTRAAAIKQDDPRAYRYLAVIGLRSDRPEDAARAAARGLEIDGADLELLYLAARAQRLPSPIEPHDAKGALTLAALAFEVGDAEGAEAILDRGLTRWPEERSLYPSRVNLALQGGDGIGARRLVAAWRERFPEDAEARQLSRRLGID